MSLPADWAWVEELIEEEGRDLLIYPTGSPSDTNKPWRGNDAGTPETATGVFVRYKEREVDGDHVRRGDQKVLMIPSDAIDVGKATRIKDSLDDSFWGIVGVDKITSGSDILLYILQVRK